MANEVVVHTRSGKASALEPGDICKTRFGDKYVMVVDPPEDGAYPAVQVIWLCLGTVEWFEAADLTPLGPCRIEVTPCRARRDCSMWNSSDLRAALDALKEKA